MELGARTNERDDGHRPEAPALTPRSRRISTDPDERQRFVAQVLNLMQAAETRLRIPNDAGAVAEALRAISAAKAMASFLNQTAVAEEATLLLERAKGLSAPGESDRGWLLTAIDRLRLLAVDPHHSSTPNTLIVSVSMSHIDRMRRVATNLSTCLSEHPDPEVTWLLTELRATADALLRIPATPLIIRLQALAMRNGRILGGRGDDLLLDQRRFEILDTALPPLVAAASAHPAGAPEMTLLLVAFDHDLVVRLSCGATITIPPETLRIVNAEGGTAVHDDDGIVTLRLPWPQPH